MNSINFNSFLNTKHFDFKILMYFVMLIIEEYYLGLTIHSIDNFQEQLKVHLNFDTSLTEAYFFMSFYFSLKKQ